MKFVSVLSVVLGLGLVQANLLSLAGGKIHHTSYPWQIRRNSCLKTFTRSEVMLRDFSEKAWQIPTKSVKVAGNIPATFDARAHWPECPTIGLIRDQSVCGHCWAFGAVEVMSDRLCIASKGVIKVNISAEDLINCWKEGHYNGTAPGPITYKYWHSDGIVTGGLYGGDGCKPYATPPKEQATECLSKEICTRKCQPGYPRAYEDDKFFGSYPYKMSQNVPEIQTEIMQNGPVTAYFMVYKDFPKPGIYIRTSDEKCDGHAVKIIGWGTENSTDYWLVANSWGTGAHEDGFFKIRRGTNEASIEEKIVAAMAKI